ncbi:MAG: hypothetical protein A2945_03855 [Candidatus Liptonbacteria bacterium RIFCSPLOWO2_01_FULL_52_25]|uniref:Uncharacterized protein n=1 Tax=Candidatus Liptonbacteria bacterium RIFCSPLOWO2_01_FULL_52_25 TaxID=1798650 RepID=A0A1G2CGC6_9BACT|nr:MAG: hypothetical protein A2945_03855 [Candidatus Liptonbacteria bacterium RIFCSPLOWO2_01_FULL_52_25]
MTKKYISAFIALEIVVGSFGSVVFAQGTATGTRPIRENACAAFVTRIDALAGKVGERREKLQDHGEERKAKLDERWAEFAAKREAAREWRDENLNARIAKLEARNLTDAQKQAVAAFHAAMDAALDAKRDAVDAAVTAHHDGIKSLLETRKAAVEAAFTARSDAYKAAVEKAKADCAAGVDIKTVRDAFVTALKVAQEQFASARKANTDFNTKVKVLQATKKAALEKAHADFKAAVEAARAALKAALPKPTSSTTP